MNTSNNQDKPNLFIKLTIYSLIYLTGIYPLNAAFANPIVPDNTRTQVQNVNNVPVVNIAPPNQSGVSHNTYKDFNVEQQGAVLNNALNQVNSQLAGKINKNPNFKDKAADLIINEVTGSNQSLLQGILEIAGKKADVMIANPNGVIVNGGGFINVKNATITTGKPILDEKGALKHAKMMLSNSEKEKLNLLQNPAINAQMLDNPIIVTQNGLNGKGADSLNIMSKSLMLLGKITANDLAIIQGINQVNYKNNTVSSVDNITAQHHPSIKEPKYVAIFSMAGGGMYADRISILSTSKFSDSFLHNLESTKGDIKITGGKVLLGKSIKAKQDIDVKSQGNTIVYNNSAMKLEGESGKTLIESGRNISFKSGESIEIIRGNLNSNGSINLESGGYIANIGTVSEDKINSKSEITTGRIESEKGITLISKGGITDKDRIVNVLSKGEIVEKDGIINGYGIIKSKGDVHLKSVGNINNIGGITSKGDLDLKTDSGYLLNIGAIANEGNIKLDINQSITNKSIIDSGKKLTIESKGTIENKGDIKSIDDLIIKSDKSIVNGVIASPGDIKEEKIKGGIQSEKNITLISKGSIENLLGAIKTTSDNGNIKLDGNSIVNNNGVITSKKNIDLKSKEKIDNLDGWVVSDEGGVKLESDDQVINNGVLSTKTNLEIIGSNVINYKKMNSKSDINIKSTGLIENSLEGVIGAEGNITLTGDNGIINKTSVSSTPKDGATPSTIYTGIIGGGKNVTLVSAKGSIQNLGGVIKSENNTVKLDSGVDITNKGHIHSNGNITLESNKISNSKSIKSKGNINIKGKSLIENLNGFIEADNNITLTSDNDIINKGFFNLNRDNPALSTVDSGNIISGNDIELISKGSIHNLEGGIKSGSDTTLISDKNIINTGIINSGGTVDLASEVSILNNAGAIFGQKDVNLASKDIANRDIIRSNGDLTLIAKANVVNGGALLDSGNNIRILASDSFMNLGNDKLTGIVKAKNNIWIQKTLDGDKIDKVTNYGGYIGTNDGDIIIRTKKFSDTDELTGIKVTLDKLQSLINSGNNLYIYADILKNNIGALNAAKNLILTGQSLYHSATNVIPEAGFFLAGDSFIADFKDEIKLENNNPAVNNNNTLRAKNILLKAANINVSDFNKIKATDGLSIAATNFLNLPKTLNLETNNSISIVSPNQISLQDSKLTSKNISLISPENIYLDRSVLYAKNIDLISHSGDVKTNSSWEYQSKEIPPLYSRFSTLLAENSLNISAGKNISLINTKFVPPSVFPKSKRISFSAGGNIDITSDYKLSQMNLKDKESIPFEELIFMKNIILDADDSISMISGGDINLTGVIINCGYGSATEAYCAHREPMRSDVTLTAANDINIKSSNFESSFLMDFKDRFKYVHSFVSGSIGANKLLLNAGRDITLEGTKVYTNDSTTILAGRNLSLPLMDLSKEWIDSWIKIYEEKGERNSDWFTNVLNDLNKENAKNDPNAFIASIESIGDLTLAANGNILTYGSDLKSKRNLTINSGGNIVFDSSRTYEFTKNNVDYEIQKGTELSARGLLTILSEGSILFKATRLGVEGLKNLGNISNNELKEAMSSGTIDIAAKGGYIYAQALADKISYEVKKTSRTWYGRKKTRTETHHETVNKVTEFSAPTGYINILAKDDATFEASKINAGKNTNIDSLQGKVNFKSVKDTDFYRVTGQSKGFFFTKSWDKGYSSETWKLPQINVGGTFTVNAAQGITSDIKLRNGQNLQNAITILGNSPGTSWIKDLNKRNDVDWHKVQDAYIEWNESNKSFNPIAGALIAVVVSAVTYGYGTPYITSAVGGGAISGSVATAGVAALASKAAVSVVANEGNLSKVFKELGSSDTVKSIATSMAISGALAGFDKVMGWSEAGALGSSGTIDPTKANLPVLNSTDWTQVAQRVAGQTLIKSGLNTAINGGSFTDNFRDALLSTVAGQIHATGANYIGDYAPQLGEFGKTISHMGLSALAAEIGGGDPSAAAAGALAAEFAAMTLGDNFYEDPDEAITASKIVGGLAGALISNSAEGVNSGANAGEITSIYNGVAHALAAAEKLKPGTVQQYEESYKNYCQSSPEACKNAAGIITNTVDFGTDLLPIVGNIKDFAQAETYGDYLLATASILPPVKWANRGIDAAKSAAKAGDYETATKIFNAVRDELKWTKENPVTTLIVENKKNHTPEWLKKRLAEGEKFNKDNHSRYAYNEVYIEKASGATGSGKYWKLDSYDLVRGDIVSRKYTQLSDIQVKTANSYLSELVNKYPINAKIANVPSNRGIGDKTLQGKLVLEIPPQVKTVPKEVLNKAKELEITIKDTTGKIYK
jgi:filamentous hemagglutinin family protein